MTRHARGGAWVWIAALWCGLALFDAMQTVLVMRSEGMHHAWPSLFAITTVSWLPWALATPLVLRLGRRTSFANVSFGWTMHGLACVAIGLAFAAWTTVLFTTFNPYSDMHAPAFAPFFLDKFWSGLLSSIVLYAGILTVDDGLRSRARLAAAETKAARLREGLSRAQLDALRRQIEPHFLFNTLNAVSALVREGRTDDALTTVAALSDFLRRTLQDSDRQEVSLREEMEFVRDYLAIQRVRFADRLSLSIDVPSDLDPAQVPNLILQPLVENAIKHGIAKRVDGGAIRIVAARVDDMLEVCVSNDGPSLPADGNALPAGIGMTNVRTRLQSLYGDRFAMTMHNRATGGVDVSFSLPFRVTTSHA